MTKTQQPKKKSKKRNPIAALLANEFHKPQIVKPKKGKGAKYTRKEKHKEEL